MTQPIDWNAPWARLARAKGELAWVSKRWHSKRCSQHERANLVTEAEGLRATILSLGGTEADINSCYKIGKHLENIRQHVVMRAESD